MSIFWGRQLGLNMANRCLLSMIIVMVAVYFLEHASVKIQIQRVMKSMRNIITEKIVVSMIFTTLGYIKILVSFLTRLKTNLSNPM